MRNFNGKLYEVCAICGEIIWVNKPFIGSVHVCFTEDEQKLYAREIARKAEENRRRLEGTS